MNFLKKTGDYNKTYSQIRTGIAAISLVPTNIVSKLSNGLCVTCQRYAIVSAKPNGSLKQGIDGVS